MANRNVSWRCSAAYRGRVVAWQPLAHVGWRGIKMAVACNPASRCGMQPALMKPVVAEKSLAVAMKGRP